MIGLVPDKSAGIVHPVYPDTYVLVMEDGSIQMRAGKASIILHPDGNIIIQGKTIRHICDSLQWNENSFNDRATNPMEPALTTIHKLIPSERSMLSYG